MAVHAGQKEHTWEVRSLRRQEEMRSDHETELTADRTEITDLTNETTIQMAPVFQWLDFGFFNFLMVQKLYTFSRHCTLKSAFCSSPGLRYAPGSSDPHLSVSHTSMTANNRCSAVGCAASGFWMSCLLFFLSHHVYKMVINVSCF